MKAARAFGLLLLIAGTLSADVVVLRDGSKVGGRVVDKGLHYEVTTDAGLRTFLRDEVDHVVASPKELLGESEKTFEEAKQQYTEALAVQDPNERNVKLKETIDKVRTVREVLASTRELFPEDKYADLDQKLMQTMQLMRLLRERVSVDLAKKSLMINPRPSASTAATMAQAAATLTDPAARADAAKRASARESYRVQRIDNPELHDIATAAYMFLGRGDADWKLQGAPLKSLQEYFAKPWIKEAAKLAPAVHLEAATWLASQVAILRKTDPSAAVEPLVLFGSGHLGLAPPGPEMEKTAKLLGLTVQNGVPGTPEGHVVRDLDGWIASSDFDLAAIAFVKEYREIDTPAVRFVWAYALTCLAQARKKGFDRSISAYNSISTTTPAIKDHLAALAKSVKAAAVCSNCLGEGKLRCTNCHGIKEVRTPCAKCGGKGKVLPSGLVMTPQNRMRMDRLYVNCLQCKSTGFEKVVRCEKCKDGYLTCRQCDGKPKEAPEFADICARTPCPDCEGDGCVFRNVRWVCPSCLGLGQKLTPKADPVKLLP